MLGLNIEDNLSLKSDWLRGHLGLTQAGVAAMIKSFPAILALNLDNLEGKVRSLPPLPPLLRPRMCRG